MGFDFQQLGDLADMMQQDTEERLASRARGVDELIAGRHDENAQVRTVMLTHRDDAHEDETCAACIDDVSEPSMAAHEPGRPSFTRVVLPFYLRVAAMTSGDRREKEGEYCRSMQVCHLLWILDANLPYLATGHV